MSKRLITLISLLILIAAMVSCQDDSTKGNLIGTVVRESTLEKIANPVLIITNSAGNPNVVNMTVNGDTLGRFEVVLERGTYDVKISGNSGLIFYTWPDPIVVEEQRATIVLLKLPDDPMF
ncbi:MAG: hypothetical protein NTY09_08035 [bacterium]|nr:hypothetical protein [bacterium]